MDAIDRQSPVRQSSRTDYRQPATYQRIQRPSGQEPLRFPTSPRDKVYLPQTCYCAESPERHYHAAPQRVYPPLATDAKTDRHIIEPPQSTAQEPEDDKPASQQSQTSHATTVNNITASNVLQTLSHLLHLDGSDGDDNNGAEAISPEIANDARWTETMTRLPLEIGHGYLPVWEPVPVPNKTEVMLEICPDHIQDIDGPPPGSRLHQSWIKEDAISNRIEMTQELSAADYDTISSTIRRTIPRDPFGAHYADNSTFLLPLTWRQELYNKLFRPISFTVENGRIPDLFVEAVIESKVLAIRNIESFLLRVWVELGVEPFPAMEDFKNDFLLLSNLLKEKIKVKDVPHLVRFDQVTLWTDEEIQGDDRRKSKIADQWIKSWQARWENKGDWGSKIAKSKTIRRNYVCGVFDVLFGLWPSPGRCMFHDGWLGDRPYIITNTEAPWKTALWVSAESTVPRCIQRGLNFWATPPPLPDTITYGEDTKSLSDEASVSLLYLDARFIVYRGPYQFKRTEHLRDHLTVTIHNNKKEILIYPHWKRYLMLRHQKALIEDAKLRTDEVSNLQLLTRSTKELKDRKSGKGGDIRYIAYELLHTYQLLFYRGVTERTPEHDGYLYRHCGFFGYASGLTSEEIALNLGLSDLSEVKEDIKAMFSSPDLRLPESRDFTLFRLRLEGLNRELMHWRPRNLWHVMRYSGYAEDSKNVWNSTITWFGIPFTVITLVVGILQATYAVLGH